MSALDPILPGEEDGSPGAKPFTPSKLTLAPWQREVFEQLTNPDVTEIRLYLPTKENSNEMEQ